jgi:PhzF family phenazine biosynthesis protein
MQRRFVQTDVFTDRAFHGNPLAVVVDGDGLDDDEMARIANWTNLSETTFLLPPTDPGADYRVRIFTTTTELPFAGHPTLGSCRAWLDHGGEPATPGTVVQECGAGLVTIRVADRLAFAAPPLVRSGPLDDALRATVERVVGVPIVDAAWADNGPGWVAVELADAETVLGVRPDFSTAPDLKLGLVGRTGAGHPPPDQADVEVRAFFPTANGHAEDPVTGSLNASIAQWIMSRDAGLTSYVARQGTALGRSGRVHVERDGDTIWIGGDVVTPIVGGIDA